MDNNLERCDDDVWAIFGSDSSSSASSHDSAVERDQSYSDVEFVRAADTVGSGDQSTCNEAEELSCSYCVPHADFEVFSHDSSSHCLDRDAGKGLRSLKAFSVGDEILRETACIRVPNFHAATSQEQADQLHVNSIRQAFEELPAPTQRCILQLSNCKQRRHNRHHDNNVSASLDRTLHGIYETNSYRLAEPNGQQTFGGLFLTIARINHSCRPNVSHFWRADLDCFLLFATRDIAVGDEICLCYLPTLDDGSTRVSQTTRDRRAFLRDGFSFHCCCDMCVEGNTCGGDDRMAKLAKLEELLPEYVALGRYDDAVVAVEQCLALLQEQNIFFGAYTKGLLGYGYQLTMDETVAEQYLERQIAAVIASEGSGCPNAIRLERILLDGRNRISQ